MNTARRAEAANSPDPLLEEATIRRSRYGGLPQGGGQSFVSLFDGRRQAPSRGDPPPLLLVYRWPERGSQPVGSFVTKASVSPPLKVLLKAPRVVGSRRRRWTPSRRPCPLCPARCIC